MAKEINPTMEGNVFEMISILLGSISKRLERCCCFFQYMRSPNLGAFIQKLFNDSGIFFRKVFLTSPTTKIILKRF